MRGLKFCVEGPSPLTQRLVFLSHVIGSPCHVVGEYNTKRVSDQDLIQGIVLEPIAARDAFDGAFVVFDLASKSSFLRVNLHQFKCPVVLVGLRCGRRLKEREVSIADVEARSKRHSHNCAWVEVDLETGENSRAAVVVLVKNMVEFRDRRDPVFVRNGSFPSFSTLRRQVKRPRKLLRESSLTAPAADDSLSDQFLFQAGSICSEVWCSNIAGIQRCASLELPIDDSSGVCGDTPLHLAAFLGNLEVVTLLLRLGASPQLRNAAGQTPLHIAAEFGGLSLCQLLVAHGADVSSVDDAGMSVLFYTILAGRPSVVHYFSDLLEEAKERGGGSGLDSKSGSLRALSSSTYTRIEDLAVKEEQPKVEPAHVAAAVNCDGVFFREAAGCIDVNVEGVFTAAACRGSMASLEYLLQVRGNAHVEIVNAFVRASETGHTHVLELLWSTHKVVVGEPESMSRALVAAVSATQLETANWLLLRDRALFVHAVQHPKILIRASAYFSDSVVLNLCEIGLDVNVADERGVTPLLAAAAHGRLKSLHVLIDRRAQLFARDKNDYGALHYACANDNSSVLESLLDLGLNPNELNRRGESPLMVAVGQGLESIVRQVLAHMARKPPRDPLGQLKLWPNGPFLQVVLELHQSEYAEIRVLKNVASSALDRVVFSLGTYMGLSVLALKHLAPVDTKRLAFRISLCCHLRHRNIVNMIGVFSDGASYTILYELPGKGPLCLLDDVPQTLWTPGAMILLLRQVLHGLVELHREGAGKPALLHRDLQLSSFMLNLKNGPMLLPLLSGAHANGFPVSGCVGARGWRPPECHSGQVFDKKSDVFGFAALLYELREGKFPFSEYHFLDIPRKILSRDRPRLSAPKSKEDEFIVSMIESCWAHDPEDRPSFETLSRRCDKFVLGEAEAQEALENIFQVVTNNPMEANERARPSIVYLGLIPSSQVSCRALQVERKMDFGDERIAFLSASPDMPPSFAEPEFSASAVSSSVSSSSSGTASGAASPSAASSSTSAVGTGAAAAAELSPVSVRLSPGGGVDRSGASSSKEFSSSGFGDDLGSLGGAAFLSPIQLMRAKIESSEYFAFSFPMSLIQSTRRLQLCQMRVLDVAHLPTTIGRYRGANHVLRALLLFESGSRLQILTHRFNYVLFDRISYMANERKMHWSPEQVRSMALQIALGMQFLSDADPPIHFCVSDKDVFVEEEAGGAMRLMVGGFGIKCMLMGQSLADMMGQPGFVDAVLLSSGAHFFNTVTDRNHRLASEATDVFAFGMLLRTILTLRRPYEGELNASDCVRQGVLLEAPNLSSSYSSLMDLCTSCINPNSKVRPTFLQIVQRLDKMTNLSKSADKFKPKQSKPRLFNQLVPSLPLVTMSNAASNAFFGEFQALLMKSNHFKSECGAMVMSAGQGVESVLEPDSCVDDYRTVLSNLPHCCMYGVGPGGPLLVIVSKVKGLFDEEPVYRALLRSQTGDERNFIPASTKVLISKKGNQSPTATMLWSAIKMINPKFEKVNFSVVRELCSNEDRRVLSEYESAVVTRCYAFGVIYAKKDQTSLAQMLSNQEHSRDFDQFLGCVGETVKLNQFSRFAGGLDTKYDSTGTESVYTRVHNCEVMLRVSTLLPLDQDDAAQLLRTRFLSQSQCLVVFQDENSSPLSPQIFVDWPNVHVVIVVRPITAKEQEKSNPGTPTKESPNSDSFSTKRKEPPQKRRYQVAVATNRSLKQFGPNLENPVFERGHEFRSWLLTKLINGVRASHQSETKVKAAAEVRRAERLSALEHRLKLIVEQPEVMGFIVGK